VGELSLRDDATGLGNRRLVDVVLEHSFAQAVRGTPLSVVTVRPPGVAEGGTLSEQRLAALLREHARASDVVARFAEGVYVVILHAAPAEGAAAFLRRVLAACEGAPLAYAYAEHDTSFRDHHELLDAALLRMGAPGVH
jgi:GGDEF domain-containing protein